MSEQKGAPEASRTTLHDLNTDFLRIVVHVDPACIEDGHNGGGSTVIPVDAASLPTEERAALRLALGHMDRHSRFKDAFAVSDPRLRGRANWWGVTAKAPTLEAVRDELRGIVTWQAARDHLASCVSRVEDLVLDAVARALPGLGADEATYGEPGPDHILPRFSDEASYAIRRGLPDDFAQALAALEAATQAEPVRHAEGSDYLEGMGSPRWPDDWLSAHLSRTPAAFYVDRLQDDAAAGHRAFIVALGDKSMALYEDAKRRSSPEGMVEAILLELGTESQVERWREGFLPDEETDAVLARHVFAPVFEVARPETRLEKDDVTRELRKARPGAGVAKLSFATEEARGLTDAEWEAFKGIRKALPPGTEANVVRTVANVQTVADGSYVLRRPLVSLKAVFAGREVRTRVDLGTGIELRAA